MSGHLQPSVGWNRLVPANAAFMARTDLAQTRMLGFTAVHQDTVTSLLQGILGPLPTVRHAGGVTADIMAFLRGSGLRVEEDVRIYRTEGEAEAHADRLIREGRKLFWPYPTRAGRFADADHLVTPAVWEKVNAKDNLAELVPHANLPPRRILPIAELDRLAFGQPVYLKAGGSLATGWGYAVRHCPDPGAMHEAKQWFAARAADIAAVIVEEDVAAARSWCAGLGITGEGVICFGGAEQLFSAPGRQSGSLIESHDKMPRDIAELAIAVGRKAAQAGFRGLAGLDIGQSADGRLTVFDPNFRFNASTAQILFHDAFATRSGMPVSLSFNVRVERPMGEVVARLEMPVETGIFMPMRLFDCSLLPLAANASLVTGLVCGADRADAEARAAALLAAISP